ncbi:thioredoxin domain-containing protein [Bosea sp. (in: a-proteobacteria)]|uniref:thioredoxin domain-containing protein n=1 Tax=Bosea sp. (in: a-proteobacteria) TaxID=1871050 RepID=UPI001AC5533D|nr:thioredoxin domain-containing protein [Bosea sp. (in: a-proteobacteria)]MBN9441956.1 thioredoxin domain-containing protein [Bosea sp. (in: a-proteobacteria)]
MNRLSGAASPYLLQHRDNPVDWWEWSPEAFAEAKRSNRPVLLSVGYAACHWCHVMAHESFENPATAAVMNELFVNIKVDREERPDIDHVYMTALHSLGEQGGWPLTMFLTPDGDAFWGGTYFPPEARHGRPSFIAVLRQIATIFQREPQRIAGNAGAIRSALQRTEELPLGTGSEPDLDHLAVQIGGAFDARHGGLRGAPKFPNTGLIELLWRAGTRTPAGEPALAAAVLTLEQMARGGIHDDLGGGFARYAVDERWLVPHFEKMLYDNAQLLALYALEANRSGSTLAREAAEGIVGWLEREMLLPEGAFAASLDADSEGVEGRYYVWSLAELVSLLGAEDAALFARHYDVTEHGNWDETNILNRLDTPDPDQDAASRLAPMKRRLLAERAKRVRPGRDDKILADWNGLAIAALARASALLDKPRWLDLAENAYRFVAESMSDGEGLAHSYRQGRRIAPGFALDHAAMTDAALALHDATLDPRYLGDARRWGAHLERHYRDDPTGLLGMTRSDSAALPVSPRPTHDDAVPNAIGVHAANLVRIAAKTGSEADSDQARRFMTAALGAAARAPLAHGSVLNAFDLARNGAEIVLAGPDRAAFHRAARALRFTTTILVDCPDAAALAPGHPASAMLREAGPSAAFICFEGRCLPPVTDPNRLAEAVAAGR